MEQLTYSQAIARIETIVRALQDASLDVDQLGKLVAEATELIALCQSKLRKAEDEVQRAVGGGADE